MSTEYKATKKYVAVHAVSTTDKEGKRIEVRPGSAFTPTSAKEEKFLVEKGAIRAVKVPKDEDKPAAPANPPNPPK